MAKTIEKSVKVARNDRRELQTRLEAYRKAFREIDDMRKSAPADGMHLVQFLEDTLVKEYRALIDAHTSIKGMVTLSPGLPIETAADARRDGMQGAEWSAVLDEHTCPLCRELDGKVISVTHPDFDRFKPPLHDGCRCIRVYILNEEENVEYTWVTPSEELLHK